MTEPNTYSDAGLDRAAHLRRDDVWLAERLVDPPTRFVPVWRARNLINGGADPRAAVLSRAALEAHLDDAAERLADSVLLGLADGAACFALDLSDIDEGLAETLGTDAGFCDLRQYGSLLPGNDAGLLAYARGILYWHRRHRFCGSCGAPTDVEEGGHLRICTDETCATPHFPRTDPAVIMLIERDGRCLLGRQKSWAPGLYSTLAGFVEPGESLEDAVRREVYEEAGIDVGPGRLPLVPALAVSHVAHAGIQRPGAL